LLDAKARSVLGRVGEHTRPAQHLLEGIGFEYLEEVDPFDGGPHYGCKTSEILPIKLGRKVRISDFPDASYREQGLMGTTDEEFRCALVSYDLRGDEVAIPSKSRALLGCDLEQEVFLSPFSYKQISQEKA
jgi:arginine N-succinyltransferase